VNQRQSQTRFEIAGVTNQINVWSSTSGSLTITNITTEERGRYSLQFNGVRNRRTDYFGEAKHICFTCFYDNI